MVTAQPNRSLKVHLEHRTDHKKIVVILSTEQIPPLVWPGSCTASKPHKLTGDKTTHEAPAVR